MRAGAGAAGVAGAFKATQRGSASKVFTSSSGCAFSRRASLSRESKALGVCAFFTSSVGTCASCIFSTAPHHLRCSGDQSAGGGLQRLNTGGVRCGFSSTCVMVSVSSTVVAVAAGCKLCALCAGCTVCAGSGWRAFWHVQRRCMGDQRAGERLGMSFLHGLGLAGTGTAVLCSVPSTGFCGSSGSSALSFAGTARSSAVLGLTTFSSFCGSGDLPGLLLNGRTLEDETDDIETSDFGFALALTGKPPFATALGCRALAAFLSSAV
mmetsp:Transcript_69402/g.165354  ORF Transcript_69402/g.165354 Transcript_69402/m.165354 type:complete len:266 (+) Transcript_69402:195-992(+)